LFDTCHTTNHTTTMKFLPTVNLDDPATHEALRRGQLRLQTGQWIRIDSNPKTKPSRFVCRKPSGSIWAIHPYGDRGITTTRFQATCKAWLS
jgi:hypothetical protein